MRCRRFLLNLKAKDCVLIRWVAFKITLEGLFVLIVDIDVLLCRGASFDIALSLGQVDSYVLLDRVHIVIVQRWGLRLHTFIIQFQLAIH